MQQTDAAHALHAFLAAEKDVGTNPADLVAAMADLAPVRERILATAVTPPTAPELTPIAKRKLSDLIAAGHVVNGLAFERQNPDGTTTRGAITVGGMVLWWHPEQQSELYEELRAAIDAGSETATHADALAWLKGAHQALADVRGLALTDEQCDAFRRLPMPFNDMVRAIHKAGAMHRTEPAAPCWCTTCRPVTLSDMRMVTCPQCGNKRCPRATDHRNACTGSNEPGQPGSRYGLLLHPYQEETVNKIVKQERSRLFRPSQSSSAPVSITVATTTEDVDAVIAEKAAKPGAQA